MCGNSVLDASGIVFFSSIEDSGAIYDFVKINYHGNARLLAPGIRVVLLVASVYYYEAKRANQ